MILLVYINKYKKFKNIQPTLIHLFNVQYSERVSVHPNVLANQLNVLDVKVQRLKRMLPSDLTTGFLNTRLSRTGVILYKTSILIINSYYPLVRSQNYLEIKHSCKLLESISLLLFC